MDDVGRAFTEQVGRIKVKTEMIFNEPPCYVNRMADDLDKARMNVRGLGYEKYFSYLSLLD